MNQGFTNTTSWRVRKFFTNVALIVTIKTNKTDQGIHAQNTYSDYVHGKSRADLGETNTKATSEES